MLKNTEPSPSCSFLPSPLNLRKPGLNNKGINPVEVSANGNKTTAVIWLRVVLWFSIQPRGHVCPQEAELEGRERTPSGDQGGGYRVVYGSLCFLTGEVMWDGRAGGWLLTWGQWQWPPAELCEPYGNFSDPYFPELRWCTHEHKPRATACHKQDGSAGAAGMSRSPQAAFPRQPQKLQRWACDKLGWVCKMVCRTCWEVPPAQLS